MSELIPRDGDDKRGDHPAEPDRHDWSFPPGEHEPRTPHQPGGRAHFGEARPRHSAGDDAIELAEVLAILRRRKWWVLVFVLLGGGFAYTMAHFQEPQYRATAVIRVDDPRSQMIEGLGGMGSVARSQTDPVLSALEVLRSQVVLGQIVEEEGLRLSVVGGEFRISQLEGVQVRDDALPDTVLLRFGAQGVEASDRSTGNSVSAPYGQELVLSSVRLVVPRRPEVDQVRLAVRERHASIRSVSSNLRARPREATNVVDVEFVSPDPELSQRVVNRAVQVFRERSAEQASRESMRRRVFLEEQLAQVDSTLQQSQRALSAFRSREQVFSSREWFAAQQAGLMEIEMRREELMADQRMYGEILDGLQAAPVGDISHRLQAVVASPEVAQNPVVASLFEQLIRYETARDSLVTGPWGASPDNPDVAWANQQITNTRDRLERAVRSHMEALDARIEALNQLRSRQAAQIQTLPESEAEEARLMQQVESVRRTVQELTSEYYRAQVAEAVEEGPVGILDLATTSERTERAGLPVMLALGVMLGFLVGAVGAVVRELLNTKIRHQSDLEDLLHVSTVGVIPKIARGSQRLALLGGENNKNKSRNKERAGGKDGPPRVILGDRPPRNRDAAATGMPAGTNGAPEVQEDLVTVVDRKSASAEAFRTLRTNLLFSRDRPDVKTLVVTSALPAEGKTITVANLAVSYAQQGLQVLAVDCDLRKPRLAAIFGFDRTPGTTDLVLGNARATEVIRKFEAVNGLHLMPSGSVPESPTELLGGARMRAALKALRQRFDVVILDTPPLSAGADAAILGSAVDGVLMVVRAGATERDAARIAARQLHTVGAHLVGAVLNDPEGEVPKYGYYYAYEYYGAD